MVAKYIDYVITIIDKNEKAKMGSGVLRGTVGGAMFGVTGAVAVAASAKKKSKYMIEIEFMTESIRLSR